MILRYILIGFLFGAAGVLAASYLLTDNQVLALAESLGPKAGIAIEQTLGELYYSIRQYERASFYFMLLMQEHSDSPEVESAFFYWLQAQRFGNLISSNEMVERCRDYLTRYPQGENASMIRSLSNIYTKRMEEDIDIRAVGLKAGLRQQAQH